jgi:uncharacterized Zn-finger protein
LIHKDEKPFRCSLCSYVARQKNSLTLHHRIHANESLSVDR